MEYINSDTVYLVGSCLFKVLRVREYIIGWHVISYHMEYINSAVVYHITYNI